MLNLLLSGLLFSLTAQAFTLCAGESEGTLVTLTLSTTGTLALPQEAVVSIAASGEGSRSYGIRREEIAQFFESASDDGARAVAGLSAFVGGENPVFLRYSGANFLEDPVTALRRPERLRERGNEMRIWKGPGFPAEQQYQLRDVVCQVVLELP